MNDQLPSQIPPPSPQQGEFAFEGDLGLLRDIIRLLPAGVTVQDEDGRFLLINDAAAAHLGMAAERPGELPAKHLNERRRPFCHIKFQSCLRQSAGRIEALSDNLDP